MVTALKHHEQANQKVILHHVSWDTYERLLFEQDTSPSTHFFYDRGTLEIMILSLKHEKLKHKIATLVEVLAEELGHDVEGAGSTTFRREDLQRGFEPDACFYFKQAAQMRQKDVVDLSVDPPPELVIENDITSPSLNKLPIYAHLGVSEVWRYDGTALTIMQNAGDEFKSQPQSRLLPGVTTDQLNQWIRASQTQDNRVWLSRVRETIRSKTLGS